MYPFSVQYNIFNCKGERCAAHEQATIWVCPCILSAGPSDLPGNTISLTIFVKLTPNSTKGESYHFLHPLKLCFLHIVVRSITSTSVSNTFLDDSESTRGAPTVSFAQELQAITNIPRNFIQPGIFWVFCFFGAID